MDKFFKVTKLNLGVDKIKSDPATNFLTKAFGVSDDYIQKLTPEENIWINIDKIVGLSQRMQTGLDDESTCYKVYFNSHDYWIVKHDDDMIKLIEAL